MKVIGILFLLILVAVFAVGCGSGGGGTSSDPPVQPKPVETKGTAVITVNLGQSQVSALGVADIAKIRIKVKANEVVQQTDEFAYTSGSTISRSLMVSPAKVTFLVDALRADGTIEFTGVSGLVEIISGQSTPVAITLEPPKTGVNVDVTIHGDLGPPTIWFTKVPPYGNSKDTVLYGKVSGILPGTCKVIVFIKVSGSWWVKPYWSSPFSKINADGSWACETYTGGYDYEATEMRAYLVTNDYPNGAMPPTPPTTQSLAMVSVTRPH